LTLAGVASAEHAYNGALENCKKAGVPIHALTPSEVAKIGRQHLELWIGPDKEARHEEAWNFDMAQNTVPLSCIFSLTHQRDETWIIEANGRVTTIDNLTHQVDVGQGDPLPWAVEQMPANEVEALRRETVEGLLKTGWSNLGVTNSNGAQCVIWRFDPTGEQYCSWTGGKQWGYGTEGDGLHDGLSLGAGLAASQIVLWAHPGKLGYRLETQAFSVGQPLDPRAFQLPANANPGTPR
jgi:hypothetical protein